MNQYECRLLKDLEKCSGFNYHDVKLVDKYPIKVSLQVLKVLLEWACQPQNIAAIELGRKKIAEIDGLWLQQHLLEVATQCVDFSDEWEYRRFVELVVIVTPNLKNRVLMIGMHSDNEEIREVVEDFKDNS